MRVGVIDTGVNPWHPHVRGPVDGCRIFAAPDGTIREDGDFRDPLGHGTAVAGVLRQGLPRAELFAVRAFTEGLLTYPSLVARAVLRAAAEGCRLLNLSLAVPPGPGSEVLARACEEVLGQGCALVAAGRADDREALPGALPGVLRVLPDDRLEPGQVLRDADDPGTWRALGRPRDLRGLPRDANLWGASFACARVSVYLGKRLSRGPPGHKDLDRPSACRYKDPLTGD